MKTFLNRICLIVALLLSALTASAYDFEVDGIYYEANVSLQTVTVVKGDLEYNGDVIVPNSVIYKNREFSVNAIAQEAFKNCGSLNFVELPNSVTFLGEETFSGCTNLENVIIPTSLTYLPDKCFYQCINITELLLPNSLESIGSSCFEGCEGLEVLNIPDSITGIGKAAFSGCKNLGAVNLPNSITQISEYLFNGCSSIESIRIPDSIKKIQEGAFHGCVKVESIVIPSSVDSVEDKVFDECYSLKSLFIEDGESILSFGKSGHIKYQYNSSITYDGLFFDAPLSNLYLGRNIVYTYRYTGNTYYPLSYCTLSPFEKKSLEEVIFGPKVTRIPNYCFVGNDSLKEVIIPANVTSIGVGAFASSTLESIEIEEANIPLAFDYPNNTSSIIPNVFSHCDSLKNVTIGRHLVVDLQGEESYSYWDTDTFFPVSIKTVKIGGFSEEMSYLQVFKASVEDSLSHYPELECLLLGGLIKVLPSVASNINLKELTICSSTPLEVENPDYTFSNSQYMEMTVNVPKGSKSNYEQANGWKLFWNIQEIEGLPTVLTYEDFIYVPFGTSNEVGLARAVEDMPVKVNIPQSFVYGNQSYTVKSIGIAFKRSNIESIILPQSIEKLDAESFMNCKYLKSMSLPNTITVIGDEVFKGCEAMETINLPKSLVKIGQSAFQDCSSINELTIPVQTTDFGKDAFVNCSIRRLIFEDGDLPLSFPYGPINSVSLPAYKYLRTYTSYFGKTVINELYLGRNLVPMPTPYEDGSFYYVYEDPFYGVESIEKLTISQNVSRIGTDYTEPISWRFVNGRSFEECTSIRTVIVKAKEPPYGACFDSNTYANAKLIIPIESGELYESAEGWEEFSTIHQFTGTFESVDELSFPVEDLTLIQNAIFYLTPTITPEDASIKELVWESSDSSIVEVSSDGMLTSGNKVGEAVVSATTMDGSNLTASVTVKVVEDLVVEAIQIDNATPITVRSGVVYISGKSPEEFVNVYDVQGRRILTTTESTFNLNSKGVYVLKVAGKSCKIIL